MIVPNVLCAQGAVLVTSTKPDVMAMTASARSRAGDCVLFDPSGRVEPGEGVRRVGWSPLRAATSWDAALGTASAMVAAAERRSTLGGPSNHWSERAGSLLASLLHAAAIGERSMADVLRWVDRHEGHHALGILEGRGDHDHPATSLLVGILATDTREQSGIWSTSSGVLGAYRALGALDSTRGELIDPATFCDDANTLYVCASGRDQAMLAPLVVGLIGEVQSAAYARAGQGRPLLLALDELANIAPLPDLPQLVSEGGGQGVLTIGCLQDLSQARARWGATADGFLSLFSTTLVLGGVADRGTLITLRDLAGQHEIGRPSSSTSRDARGRRSSSVSLTINREERLGLDEAARLETGTALLLDAAKQLGRIELTAAYRDEPWRSLIGPGRARAELGRVR